MGVMAIPTNMDKKYLEKVDALHNEKYGEDGWKKTKIVQDKKEFWCYESKS